MNLDALFATFKDAQSLYWHRDFVGIGSLSVLSLEQSFEIANAMTMSNDITRNTQTGPKRIFDVVAALGENPLYH